MPRKTAATKATEKARAAVFAALWSDPAYLALNETKEAALKAWNRADAYKNHPAHRPGELEAAETACTAALKACTEYENAALKAAGFPW